MPSTYHVLQLVPDAIRDERINVGVLTRDDTGIFVKLTPESLRVRRFASRDVGFLGALAKRIEEAARAGRESGDIASAEFEIYALVQKWSELILITPPRRSMQPASVLLNEVASEFLTPDRHAFRRIPGRREIAKAARHEIRKAVAGRMGSAAEELVKVGYPIQGELQPHAFDTAVANGSPYFVAHTISFRVQDLATVRKDLSVLCWMVSDVRKRLKSLPIGVVTLAPVAETTDKDERQDAFDETQRIMHGLEATFLTESQVAKWAQGCVAQLPPAPQVGFG